MNKTNTTFLIFTLTLASACSRSGKDTAEQEPAKTTGPVLVEMKGEAQEHVGLQVAQIAISEMKEYLQVIGTVQPVDSKVGQVRSLARGRIQQVMVKVGDRVEAGQTLASLDNIEAGELLAQQESARADLQKLRVQLATQAKQLERNRQLVEIGAAPQKDYETSQGEADALKESIRSQESVVSSIGVRLRRFGVETATRGPVTTPLHAPFAGVVTKVQAAPGEVAEEGKDLITVVDLSRVWVQAEVYEKDIGRILRGQSAFITVDTYPHEQFQGVVTYVSDILDPQTRTARVRCEVPNPEIRLKLDMFATVLVPTTFSHKAIAVPESALQQIQDKTVVFIRKDKTKFELRLVQTGKTINGLVEIKSGVQAGDVVVTQGGFHLKSILAGKELAEE